MPLTVFCLTAHLRAQPAVQLAIQADPATGLVLTVMGEPGASYALEYSETLGQHARWNVAAVRALPSGTSRWSQVVLPAAPQRFYRAKTLALQPATNMMWVSAGTFLMGSPSTEAQRSANETQREVTLTQGFFIGKFEVTQGDYTDLMGVNPSVWRNGTNAFGTGGAVTNELLHPVDSVSWFDATAYCARLTEQERSAGRLPSDWVYRLPTEAEWEYACRAGTTTSHHYGDALRSGMANFRGTFEYDAAVGTVQNPEGEYLGRTVEVGRYEPNAWGLHDMHGNVWEWCRDWRGDYPPGPVTNPTGPSEGLSRVIRGGDWGINGWYCRSARRFGGDPGSGRSHTGFRVVLAPVDP